METAKINWKRVVDYLNVQADRDFKYIPAHKKFIDARIKEGFTMENFKQVVDTMVAKWGLDPKMDQYLRPATLFGNKMDGYLNLRLIKEKSSMEKFGEKANDWIKERSGDVNGSGVSKGSGDSKDGRLAGARVGDHGGLVSKPGKSKQPRLPDGRTPYPED